MTGPESQLDDEEHHDTLAIVLLASAVALIYLPIIALGLILN